MKLEEKAKEYAQNNNYNPYVYGDAERHYTIGLEKGFMAGYNAFKEESEWKPIESRPESGRMIVHRHKDTWGNFAYQVILFEGIENVPENGYEWKYID